MGGVNLFKCCLEADISCTLFTIFAKYSSVVKTFLVRNDELMNNKLYEIIMLFNSNCELLAINVNIWNDWLLPHSEIVMVGQLNMWTHT